MLSNYHFVVSVNPGHMVLIGWFVKMADYVRIHYNLIVVP